MVYLSDESQAQTGDIYGKVVLKYTLLAVFLKLSQRFKELEDKFQDTSCNTQ